MATGKNVLYKIKTKHKPLLESVGNECHNENS